MVYANFKTRINCSVYVVIKATIKRIAAVPKSNNCELIAVCCYCSPVY
nr:MAG TPA: hypothetical protein [Caudoviricetes sp.]